MHSTMRTSLTGRVGAVGVSLCLAACAVSQGAGPPESTVAPSTSRPPTSATVITAADLSAMNRPLIDVLKQKLPGMQVTQTPGCPEVVLRGRSTLASSSSPAIYVDGNQASNTCILNELRTADLDQVEIYPGGVAPRGGYRAHPYGVILIFVKRAE